MFGGHGICESNWRISMLTKCAWETYTWYIQFSSVAQSCPTLCDPMDCSMPGFPVHHQLPEFIQTHVHWVSDAILPSHLLLSPSPPAFNLSRHQGLFKWVSSSHQVAKILEASASASVLPMNIQDWFPLGWTGLILLAVKGSNNSSLKLLVLVTTLPFRKYVAFKIFCHFCFIYPNTCLLFSRLF